MGERSWRPRKNLSKCYIWGMGGCREPRKKKPERLVAQLGREEHRTWGLSAGLAATTSHRAGLRERRVVMLIACFLRGVSSGLSWGAELGVPERRGPWKGRERRKGASIIGEFIFETRQPVHMCQLREESLPRERPK